MKYPHKIGLSKKNSMLVIARNASYDEAISMPRRLGRGKGGDNNEPGADNRNFVRK